MYCKSKENIKKNKAEKTKTASAVTNRGVVAKIKLKKKKCTQNKIATTARH